MGVDYSKFDDETLIRLISRAQPDALSVFYDRYNRFVYSIAYKTVADPEMAEEITQDTFLRVWQHASSYQSSQGKLTTWLASIARHRAIDVYRRRQARRDVQSQSLDDLVEMGSDQDKSQDIENQIEITQRSLRVQSALKALPEEQRQALFLAYFHGLTQDEIAQTLHHPLGTVKTRIRLGMEKLRLILRSEDSE